MHTSVRGNQELLTPGEQIAENILSLLDEPDSTDKRWRAPIFRQLPDRFAENAAYDYKETYIFEGRRNANQSLLKAYGKPDKHSIPLNATDDDLKALSKQYGSNVLLIRIIYCNNSLFYWCCCAESNCGPTDYEF